MAISTEGVYLTVKKASDDAFKPMVPITEFPDTWKAPDNIDVTTMSDHQSKSIKDIVKLDTLEFTAFFEKDAVKDDDNNTYMSYTEVVALNDEESLGYELCFGDINGSKGKLTWEGNQSCGIKGGSVSSAVQVGIAVYPKTQIKYVAGA